MEEGTEKSHRLIKGLEKCDLCRKTWELNLFRLSKRRLMDDMITVSKCLQEKFDKRGLF